MEFDIDRRGQAPLYLQIAAHLREMISSGAWPPGSKIPTERYLAKKMRVSRNTVSMAYSALEAQGLLACQQGRGTYVKGWTAGEPFEKHHRLGAMIDLVLRETVHAGITLEEFLEALDRNLKEVAGQFEGVSGVFIECNREQVDYFTNELAAGSGLSITPLVLGEFEEKPLRCHALIRSAPIVITTFFHLQEVKRLIAGRHKRLVAIALEPMLETIVRLARYPAHSNYGLLCKSEQFALEVEQSLRAAGIDFRSLNATNSRDPEVIRTKLRGVDVLIHSPCRLKDALELLPEKEKVEFVYRPDAASINLLRSALAELQQPIA
ncbi:MAG: GntR family transcriptional regulator [Firmicutes bacterium]|nr:GntR family transcriptional regulator [Bacillota bacterium]